VSRKARKALYGLIGYPVSHSLSPEIFRAAFEAVRMDAIYDLFPVHPEHLTGGLEGLLEKGVRGLNVTVPHKSAVIPMMADLDDSARLTGAVNAIEVTDWGMVGYNTDMGGFEDSLIPLGVPDLSGARVMVLGAGGAARAIVVSLARSGVSEIVVANRFIKEAKGLVTPLSKTYPDVRFKTIPLAEGEVEKNASGAVLCVQATSLGLNPGDPLPVNPNVLPPGCFLYDLVYGSENTPWVRAALASGFTAADGKEMLLRQAARTFVLWFGREAPLKSMRTAVSSGIGPGDG
jgi:shikimate dehydrogenase